MIVRDGLVEGGGRGEGGEEGKLPIMIPAAAIFYHQHSRYKCSSSESGIDDIVSAM